MIIAPSTFLATTRRGIVRASRQKDTWEVQNLLQDHDVRCLAHDPLRPHVVYAGTQGSGIFKSDDSGVTWHFGGMQGHTVKNIAVSPLDQGIVVAGTKPPCIFISEDSGDHWKELDAFRRIPSRRFWFSPAELPGTAYVQGIALSPSNSLIIVVGIEFGAVVRSEDGGKTWSGHKRNALRDCHSLLFHPTDGEYVYEAGGSGGGVAMSRDAGNTWMKNKEGLDRHYGWACAADPVNPSVWYCSVSPGPMKAHSPNNAQASIFRSKNGGPWTKLTNGLPDPLNFMPYALLTDMKSPGHLYAGLSNGEVWYSRDYGDSWNAMPFRFDEIHRAMIMI